MLHNHAVRIIFNKWWSQRSHQTLWSNFVLCPGAYYMSRARLPRGWKKKKNVVREITDRKTSPAIEERNFYEGTTNLLRILNSEQAIHTYTTAMYSLIAITSADDLMPRRLPWISTLGNRVFLTCFAWSLYLLNAELCLLLPLIVTR